MKPLGRALVMNVDCPYHQRCWSRDQAPLFGLGLANICGSFFSAYPTTGGFSRSAVNHESGAKTGLAGVFTGIIMGCALFVLTPLFTDVPQCVLAAIVISAVIGLVDYGEAILLWQINKKDFVLWTIACLVTLFLGIEIGVLVGVVASLAFVIHESANPHIAVLGRLPGTTIYRNIQQYPESYTYSGIVIVRVDAPIYFANVSYIRERVQELVVSGKNTVGDPEAEKLHFIIIEMDQKAKNDDGHEIFSQFKQLKNVAGGLVVVWSVSTASLVLAANLLL